MDILMPSLKAMSFHSPLMHFAIPWLSTPITLRGRATVNAAVVPHCQ